SDYIKVCTNISLEQFKAELIATAIAQQLQVARAAKCFECRGLGCIRKQCPKGQKGNIRLSNACPHCQNKFQLSNQCWSKFDKHSNLL
ncbi:POK9 protein, partial [Nicator chloris]|nr:POK9 protein [Nicator chloris]